MEEAKLRIAELEMLRLQTLERSLQMKKEALEEKARESREIQRLETLAEVMAVEAELLEIQKLQLVQRLGGSLDLPPGADSPLQPGEELSIEFLDAAELNRIVTVGVDGTISLPIIGTVSTKGQTPRSLGQKITQLHLDKQMIKQGAIGFEVFRTRSSRPGNSNR